MTGQDHEAAPVIVKLPDEIDMVNAEKVRDLLVRAAVPGVGVVVANLADTTFCDSAALRELVAAHRTLAAAGVDLRLATPQRSVRRVWIRF